MTRRGRGRGRRPVWMIPPPKGSQPPPPALPSSGLAAPLVNEKCTNNLPPSESGGPLLVKRPKRKLASGDRLKFGTLTLLPGKPRKWKIGYKRIAHVLMPCWQPVPGTEDPVLHEMQQKELQPTPGIRRTGRTTRAAHREEVSLPEGGLVSQLKKESVVQKKNTAFAMEVT